MTAIVQDSLTRIVLWLDALGTTLIYPPIHLQARIAAGRVLPGLVFEIYGLLPGQDLEVFLYPHVNPVDRLLINDGALHVVVRPVIEAALLAIAERTVGHVALQVVVFDLSAAVVDLSADVVVHAIVTPIVVHLVAIVVHQVAHVVPGAILPVAGVLCLAHVPCVMAIPLLVTLGDFLGQTGGRDPALVLQ